MGAVIWSARTRGLTPAKAWFDRLTTLSNVERAKAAKFGIERLIILQTILFIFSDLCGLGVFAGDIPSFGYGCAAIGQ